MKVVPLSTPPRSKTSKGNGLEVESRFVTATAGKSQRVASRYKDVLRHGWPHLGIRFWCFCPDADKWLRVVRSQR